MFCTWLCLLSLPLLVYGENWQLQKRSVCFGAKNSQFGKFKIRQGGLLRGIKLVHTKGQVTCRHGWGHSNWGCGGKKIILAVTTSTNKVIFPKNLEGSGHATLPKYTAQSAVIILDNPAYEPKVRKGQNLRLWYGEDLKDWWEDDNSGRSCADVYANIVPDHWRLQKSNVCFGAKNNQFGTFRIRQTGTLNSIKLVHKNGYVACWCGWGMEKTKFGCNERLSTVITNQRNQVAFPSNLRYDGFYKLPPYTGRSKELVLDNPTSHNYFVRNGQEMRIWYGEDLKDHWDHDNCGTSCVDVYAFIAG